MALPVIIGTVVNAMPPAARAATIQCPPYTTQSNPCVGTDGNDTLYGTNVNDYIVGKAGDDTLWGYADFDQLHAGDFSDTNRGGDGTDYLYGGKGLDDHKAGAGDDRIYDTEGSDIWYPQEIDVACGWSGNDLINVQDGDGWDYYSGGTGSNTIYRDPNDDPISASDCDRLTG